MNNTKILAAAARRWPQDLQKPAFREWSAELAAMDRSMPDTLRNRWLKFRFVWSLLMSKPPQTGATMSTRRVSRSAIIVASLFGIGAVLGTVMPTAREWTLMDSLVYESLIPNLVFAVLVVALSALLFLLGSRSRFVTEMPLVVTACSIMLGGGSTLFVYSVTGHMDPSGVVPYFVLAAVALIFLARALRGLVERSRYGRAWLLGVVGLYVLFTSVSLLVPLGSPLRFAGFDVFDDFALWYFVAYDSPQATVLSIVIPLTALIIGWAVRKSSCVPAAPDTATQSHTQTG